jgi:hypothetical protein
MTLGRSEGEAMSDHETVRGPMPDTLWPAGRFKRLVMEFEVELVDEDALRAFDLHATADEQGNFTGLLDMDVNERVGWAVSTVFGQAMQAAQARTGIKWLAGSGPTVRLVDESGNYREKTYPPMPQRRDDGSYDDVT